MSALAVELPAAEPAAPLLEIRDAWKAFGRKQVLAGLSLAVRRGEVLTLLGPSGCGRSVLLKLIIGLLPLDRGAIVSDGLRVGDLGIEALTRLRQRVGMVFQTGARFDSRRSAPTTHAPCLEATP